ncbi:hypothetical protein, partial [Mycoplasmopsis meleagridis]|uniref:hypothetical protein n=1 Tax=Mycoplasmopsis meleagridis TaxID=29561 RepID=UPI00073D7F52
LNIFTFEVLVFLRIWQGGNGSPSKKIQGSTFNDFSEIITAFMLKKLRVRTSKNPNKKRKKKNKKEK